MNKKKTSPLGTADELFREIMFRCRQERKLKSGLTVRDLSKRLGITENYLSSIENGREMPSLKTFLEYLTTAGFETSPLLQLVINQLQNEGKGEQRERTKLVQKVYSLNNEQVKFMLEQAKVAEFFRMKQRTKKSN